jgi:hypothetical protein
LGEGRVGCDEEDVAEQGEFGTSAELNGSACGLRTGRVDGWEATGLVGMKGRKLTA